MKAILAALCILAAVFCGEMAVNAAPNIWGKPLMKQPFDKEPLREIQIPQWVQNLSTVTYCFSGMTAEQRERAAKAGAEISEMNFVDPFYTYYDSKILLKRNPGVDIGRIDKEIAAYNKLGVKILGVVPPGLIGEIYYKHPEWRRIGTNTTDIPTAENEGYGGPLCETGPWGDQLIDILVEIVKKHPDVVSFSFDGLHDYGYCYCKNCRDAFRADTGKEIPNPNMDDPNFRLYQFWVDRRMENVVEKMQNRLKAINPNIALITWSTNAGRFGHFLSIPRNMSARMNLLFDAPDQEFWMDESNRGNTVIPAFANAYMWAVSNHRVAFSSPYVMSHGNPYGADSFPPEELVRRAMLVLTWGPRPSMAIAGNKRIIDATYKSIEEAKKREPWTTGRQPEPWAAMVMSDNTKTFYGREAGRVEERYLSNVLGVFRTAIEQHLPVTVINDWNLNTADLSKYKVLVLPNTACLNEEQAAAIREFVKNGGGLVASVDTSLFDEMGNTRKDFLLADVFGVHYTGVASGSGKKEALDPNFEKAIDASYWEKRKSIFDFKMTEHPLFDSAKMKDYLPDGSSCFKGQAVAVSADADAQVIATITGREAGQQPSPSVVVHTFGKGKVVYLPAGFDSAYYLYPYPYQRLVLAQAMRWAAPEQPKISVEAPMCVHSTFYRQKTKGDRLVVHLYNDFNSSGNHAKPEDDVPLREEVVPIAGITVTYKDYNIKKVTLEPEGTLLTPTKLADGSLQITVPKLDVHTMVVAELAQSVSF
ncbi:MAG: beta-galactosidase trimerization domain-containing protein [Armatimonadota bacterium]